MQGPVLHDTVKLARDNGRMQGSDMRDKVGKALHSPLIIYNEDNLKGRDDRWKQRAVACE